MKGNVWQKKIPTLVGILFIIIGISITSYLVKTGTSLIGIATPSNNPKNIRITNVSTISFSVSYTTSDAVIGVVSFGTSKNLSQTALDDRDQKSGTPGLYKTHHITIKNLKPNTKYFFSITSGPDTFLNNDSPFEIETADITPNNPPSQKPMSGTIVLPEEDKSEALIYVTTPGSQTLSTITKNNGSYILPLNSMLTANLSSYVKLDEDSLIKMLVENDTLKSTISLFPTQIDPVPLIILSQNYDFTQGATSLSPSQNSATESAETGFPSFSASIKSTKEPEIISPEEDEKFTDQKPLFRGTALPSSDVTISINSESLIETVVQANSSGNWTFRPDSSLSPGEHTISITSRDQFSVLKTITKKFTVYAAGTQIEGASPSGTPTPIPTQGALPTATPTSAPIIQPSEAPTPTLIPTSIPIPITKGGISPPGSSAVTILGIIALGTTATGILLVFLARRSAFL